MEPLQIGEIMSTNKIMQFSYFYWNTTEKKADDKMTLFHDGICHDCDNCVMLLEKCIMGYYVIIIWFVTVRCKHDH